MTEETTSLEEIVPNWIRGENHEVVDQIDTVLAMNGTLAVTRHGLTKYPQAFESINSFIRFNAEMFSNARDLGSNLIQVPRGHSGLVLKRDVAGEAVRTLLTLATIPNAVPSETTQYKLQTIPLYWAFDQPDISMIAMGKVEPLHAHDQDSHRRYIEARTAFMEEAKKAGFATNPLPYQDLLFLGVTEVGKPIIALIDEAHPDILDKLKLK